MRVPVAFVVAASLVATGCVTYEEELGQGLRAFEKSEHERALAIFRVLEPDVHRLPVAERAHYAYLRGMTDYRIGYKADARHWLSIAAAMDAQSPGSLPADWAKRTADSLHELNEAVYTSGTDALYERPKATADEDTSPPASDTPAKNGAPASDKDD